MSAAPEQQNIAHASPGDDESRPQSELVTSGENATRIRSFDRDAHKNESRRRVKTILEWYGIPYVDNATTRRYINCPEPHDATNKRHLLMSAVQKRVEDYECIISKFLRQESVVLQPDACVSTQEFMISLRNFISDSGCKGARPNLEKVLRKTGEYGIQYSKYSNTGCRDDVYGFLIGVGLRDRDDNELL